MMRDKIAKTTQTNTKVLKWIFVVSTAWMLYTNPLLACDIQTKNFKVEYSIASQSFILSKNGNVLDRYKVNSLNNNSTCKKMDFYIQHNLIVAELDLGSIGTSSVVDEISLVVLQVKNNALVFHLEHSLLVEETIGAKKMEIEKWSYKVQKMKDHIQLTILDKNGKKSLVKKFK